MQWHIQAGNVTTNIKAEVEFDLPAFSATNIVTWKFHVDESTMGRYDIIIGRYFVKRIRIKSKIL